jgi:hypothetical protein
MDHHPTGGFTMQRIIPLALVSILVLLILPPTSHAQVYKLRSKSLAIRSLENETWSDWSDWEDTNVLMTIDLDEDRITIYSKVTQVYDVAEYEGKITDQDGDDVMSFFCVDKDGTTCRIRFIVNHEDERYQLYVDYKDFAFVYNVYFLD